MKDFLLTTLPWMIAVTCVCFSVVVYLMYVRCEDQCKKLYGHWEESTRINKAACYHIKLLESQLRHSLDQDRSNDGELWKDL